MKALPLHHTPASWTGEHTRQHR